MVKHIILWNLKDEYSKEQKAQIINENVQKLMQTEEVTAQIAVTVSAAESFAAGISELKANLDDYRLFYEGLQSYTSAVSSAAEV